MMPIGGGDGEELSMNYSFLGAVRLTLPSPLTRPQRNAPNLDEIRGVCVCATHGPYSHCATPP